MTILIRPRLEADALAVARVRIDTWRAAYQGIVPDEYLASLDYALDAERFRQGLLNPRPGVCHLVAEDTEQGVIGFATGGPERDGFPGYPGELYAMYVLPTWQGQGIGRRLTEMIFDHLRGLGYEHAIIWALEQNVAASAFYRRLGGVPVGQKQIEIGGKSLVEIGFGYQLSRQSPSRPIEKSS